MGFREPDVYQEAIQLVEDVIAEATKEGDELTAQVVMDHTALLNGAGRDRSLAKHYFERYLASNPDSPRVLYEFANDAMEDAQSEVAEQFAKRCYQAVLRSNNPKIKSDLLDLVLERWPDAAE